MGHGIKGSVCLLVANYVWAVLEGAVLHRGSFGRFAVGCKGGAHIRLVALGEVNWESDT